MRWHALTSLPAVAGTVLALTLLPLASALIPVTTAQQQGRQQSDPLQAALLTLDDLPSGWTATQPSDTSNDSVSCADTTSPQPVSKVEADFVNRDGPAFVSEEIDAEAAGQGQPLFDQAAAQLSDCPGFTLTLGDGTVLNATLTPDPAFPTLGDETAAYQLQLSGFAVPLVGESVSIRNGDDIITLFALQAGTTLDTAGVQALATKAETKLATTLSGQ
jgi:hypothetical protein